MLTARRLALAAPVLLAIAFLPFLDGDFVWDDAPLIRDNPGLRTHDGLHAILTQDLWGQATGSASQLYHPLPVLTLWLQIAAWGVRVAPLRAFNVAAHAAVVGLFVLLLVRLRLSRALAVCAGLCVLVHPSVTEPVMWITGRHDTLAMAFVLAALLCWPIAPGPRSLPRALASGALLAGAFFCKEPYVIGPGLLVAYALAQALRGDAPPRLRELGPPLAALLLPLIAAFEWRRALHISLGAAQAHAPLAEHARNYASVVAHYAVQLLSLRNGPTLAQYVPLNTGAAVGVWIALVVSVVALAVGASRRRDLVPVCLGAVWFLLSLVPHVISVPSIGMYGNRYGYCGLFGLALAVSAILACLPPLAERVRSLALAGALVLALMLAAATALEASHWRSNLALYSVDVERDPDNGYALYHLGTALSTDGGCAKALPAFVRATQLAPRYERPWHNVAGCLINLGRAADALTYARRSVELEPHNVRARYNLAVVFAARGDHAAARSELQRALALEPDYTPAQRALAALAATPGTLPAEAPSAQ